MEELRVCRRTVTGKQACRQLRREGLIPATLYHRGDKSIDVSIHERDFLRVLRGHGDTGLVTLLFDEDKASEQQAIYKDVQADTFKRRIMHVDLQGVRAGEKVTLDVPVILIGTPTGVTDQGGIMVHQLNDVTIRCEPRFIVEKIEIDISGLKLHETITVTDLSLPEGIQLANTDDTSVIASVVEPKKQVVAAEEAEGEEAAEGEATPAAAAGAPATTPAA